MIWLLASESKEGSLPCDIPKIAFRLHQTSHEIVSALKPLISKGFVVLEQGDSEMLAERTQSAVPETEAETYKQETEGEAEIQNPPPVKQHPLNYARRMIEVLGISDRILRSVESGIMAEVAYSGNDIEDVCQYITNWCSEARLRGVPIDKFTFDDTKWRNGNGSKRQISAVEERVGGNRAVLADTARTLIAQRVGSDSDEFQDGARAALKRGVRASAV